MECNVDCQLYQSTEVKEIEKYIILHDTKVPIDVFGDHELKCFSSRNMSVHLPVVQSTYNSVGEFPSMTVSIVIGLSGSTIASERILTS